MKEFECPDVGITVGRGVIDAFVAAFGPYKTRGEKVVSRHLGLASIGSDTDAIFPLRRFLNAMSELQEQFGGPFMRKVGSYIFDKAVFPPGIDTVEKGMELLNVAYYMNHSKDAEGRIGGYHWRVTKANEGKMVCDNPYPCAFDMGIIETVSRRFVAAAKVTHEPGSCRHEGGAQCAYKVEW